MAEPERNWNSILKHVGLATKPPKTQAEMDEEWNRLKAFESPDSNVVPIKPDDPEEEFNATECCRIIERENNSIRNIDRQMRDLERDRLEHIKARDHQVLKWVEVSGEIGVLDAMKQATIDTPPAIPTSEE